MISVDTIYQHVDYWISKELGSGYNSPPQFNALSQDANQFLFNKYSAGYQETQVITDKIRPFIKKSVLAVSGIGRIAYPSDYVRSIAVRAFEPITLAASIKLCDADNPIMYDNLPQINVKVIDNDKLGNRLSSKVVNPTSGRPIVSFYDTYLQVYPNDVGSVIFEYLRKPADPFWNYTIQANGLELYNPIGSVDFEWNWIAQNEIICKIAEYFGVSVREEQLIQATNMLEQQQQ